ncbi:MAG: hypothetical protein JW783_00425 [Bacteroidales bacterium]|nr:hypothetical protein [Bacteroidales bacterium]MBN2748486.1 hypothetical protein [Bacteroidales bacterium]
MAFRGHQLTPIVVNKQPCFIAYEVCEILGLTNPSERIKSSLDKDEYLPYVLHRSGQKRSVNLVTESGLYSLIFQSRKPEAKSFRKWVTAEVLPSIRKNGHYGNGTMQHLTAIESGITALIGAVTSLTETFGKVTNNINERLTKLEQQSVVQKKQALASVSYIDARNQEYDFTKINHNGVRRITINETVYYSISDFCQAIGANTGAWQIARKLNSQRPTAIKIWLFGNTHPAWFTTKNGLRLIVSGSQKLKGDNNIKLELRRA